MYLELSEFDESKQCAIEKFIYNEALRLEAHSLLNIKTIQFLKKNKILSPTDNILNRMIARQRRNGRQDIFDNIQSRLPINVIHNLNKLLEVDGEISQLEFLKKPAYKASSHGILNLIKKLECIKNTGAVGIDISEINNNYQKILSREVLSYSVSKGNRAIV